MNEGVNRLILFKVAGLIYALRLGDVAEVIEPPPIYPVPGTPGSFSGMINFHGNLVAVVDLADFMGRGGRNPNGQLLVVAASIANLALWVESVDSVCSADLVKEESASGEELVEKVLVISGRQARLLALERLVQGLEEGLASPSRP